MERLAAKMDDKNLLICALSGEYQQLGLDEGMASSYRPEDSEMANRMIEFRRETIRMIEHFFATSPFNGQIVSIWHAKKNTKAV